MVMSDAADESELNLKFSFGVSDLKHPSVARCHAEMLQFDAERLVTRRPHRLHAKSEAEDLKPSFSPLV